MKSCDQCLKEMNTLFRVRFQSKEWILCVEDAWKLCDQTIRIINMEERRIEKQKMKTAEPKATAADRFSTGHLSFRFFSSASYRSGRKYLPRTRYSTLTLPHHLCPITVTESQLDTANCWLISSKSSDPCSRSMYKISSVNAQACLPFAFEGQDVPVPSLMQRR